MSLNIDVVEKYNELIKENLGSESLYKNERNTSGYV